MTITPKIRFKYMVECNGLYFQCVDRMKQPVDSAIEDKAWKFSRNKSDGKKFDSINAAREISGEIGGSRIVRVDLLNGDVEDVRKLMLMDWKGAKG